MISNLKFIHYSHEIITHLIPQCYLQNFDEPSMKPDGFWVSCEIGIPNEPFTWKAFCEDNENLSEGIRYAHEVKLHEHANLLYVDTPEKVIDLARAYRVQLYPGMHANMALGWKPIVSQYQGIVMAPYFYELRFNIETSWYYGWDCASACVWDLDAIESIQLMEEMP